MKSCHIILLIFVIVSSIIISEIDANTQTSQNSCLLKPRKRMLGGTGKIGKMGNTPTKEPTKESPTQEPGGKGKGKGKGKGGKMGNTESQNQEPTLEPTQEPTLEPTASSHIIMCHFCYTGGWNQYYWDFYRVWHPNNKWVNRNLIIRSNLIRLNLMILKSVVMFLVPFTM